MYPVAQHTFDEADEALNFKLSKICWEGPEEKLRLTEITQPAILTMSIAAFRVLQEKGIVPQYAAALADSRTHAYRRTGHAVQDSP